MLRHSVKALIVLIALTCLIQDTQAAHHQQPRRKVVVNYLFGGYGRGPFGYGDFMYNGRPTTNYDASPRNWLIWHH